MTHLKMAPRKHISEEAKDGIVEARAYLERVSKHLANGEYQQAMSSASILQICAMRLVSDCSILYGLTSQKQLAKFENQIAETAK